MIHDSQVVAAAWDEADASLADDGRSVVVKRSTIDQNEEEDQPSVSDRRIAQLPDDPFEDKPQIDYFEEPMPEPEIPEVEDAVEDETDRSEAQEDYDLFDSPTTGGTSKESIDDQPDLEEANSELFDSMTSDEEDELKDQSEESPQYSEDLDLNLPQPPTGEITDEQRRLLAEEREASEESCQDEIEKLRAQTVETIDLSIRVDGNMGEDFPFECALGEGNYEERQWPEITYMWKASGLCHKPLYFEQVQLERYGHSWGPYTQPIMSGIHFFGTLPILPYKMGLETPNECVYALGYYRPGNCAPYLVGGVPFTWRAAAFEAGTATGLSFLIP